MRLTREVPDFTAIARSSLYQAIAIRPAPFQAAKLQGLSPLQTFVACLFCGASFRGTARCAGLNRPQAKNVLRLISKAALERHNDAFGQLTRHDVRHVAAWAFSEKQRQQSPSRLDRDDQHAVWTHVWIDDETGLLRHWLVGPSPSILRSTEPPSSAERARAHRWIATKPRGIATKVDLHEQAVTFFAIHHNFCFISARGATPAILAGGTERPWTAQDLASLAFGTDAEGAA